MVLLYHSGYCQQSVPPPSPFFGSRFNSLILGMKACVTAVISSPWYLLKQGQANGSRVTVKLNPLLITILHGIQILDKSVVVVQTVITCHKLTNYNLNTAGGIIVRSQHEWRFGIRW